jgi:hypothetical protein
VTITKPNNPATQARILLSEGHSIVVRFRKKDGTETTRSMTRNLTLIPKKMHPKFVRPENPHYITGFDIDKQGWIRFHEDDILSVL